MDKVTGLFEELAQLGVTLAAESGQLRIRAAKGALTSELQRRVAESKEEILQRLQVAAAARGHGGDGRLAPDPAADALAFPLADLQLGFYIANDPYMEYHVRPHCYLEFDRLDLDAAAYQAAWNKALARHRRELCIINGDLELQTLQGDIEIGLKVYDLRGLPAEEASSRLLRLREEMKRQELPLDRWPWLDLRVSLWREDGRERARIHYNHNNFFIDGYGTMQLLAEVDEYCRDPRASHPPLELSYRDAVLGLQRLSESEAGEAARRYWLSRLPGLPPPPDVPLKTGLNRRCRSRLERRSGALEKGLWDAFKRHASRAGVTPSNAILCAYAYVIAAWSNSDHFIFSQMVTRRFTDLHPDLGRMLGNFASLYPLEIRLDPAASFVENARRIQGQVLEDLKHLQFGGMRVLQELNRLKGSFGTAPSPFVVGSGLFIKKYRKGSFTLLETSQTVLDHQFFELDDGSYSYVWDLLEEFFPDGVVDGMWESFAGLLQRLVQQEEAWQRTAFDLVGERDLSERRSRNRTAEPVSSLGLHDALREQASIRGDDVVLRGAQGSLSYRELERLSVALATKLAAQGCGKGALVPVAMDRDQELLIAVMAILKAGGAYVPIDPRLPQERLALLLGEIGSGLVLTTPRYLESIAWPQGVTPVPVSSRSAEQSGAPAGPALPTSGSDLAYVIYTSGSTGRPKGVMIDHRGALNTVLDVNRRFAVGPADRIFGISAFNFDLSVYDIFGTVAAGARLVYPDPESALDPGHWLELVLREGVTIWNSVPALLSLLVESARRRGTVFPTLRLVMLSGDKIPLDLPAQVRQIAPNASIVSLGGATEASIWSILYPIGEVDSSWSTIPYGYPMANQTWHVLDRHHRPCPRWVPGELYIGGIGLAQGYWKDPEKTRRSFLVDPLTSERLYRTGDRGRYLAGGLIEWMGRVDFQVKLQGHRIELGEIEMVLSEHPAVAGAVVTVQDSPATRQPRLVGHVVPEAEADVDAAQLQSFLEGKLPSYMVPTGWRIVDRLPLTENGKVDRKALMEARPAEAQTLARREPVGPGNDVERRLKAIWERVLGLAEIGVTDDFFELGGQSFDAIRIFAMVRDELDRTYTLSDMWQARTIRELAMRIAGEQRERRARVVPIDSRGSGRPLFLVHPAGGSVMAYSSLAGLIGRPLYGIQADASPEEAARRRDLVELARHYVAEIRAVQAQGPYSLGGWSTGAMIAFEMAAQLESGAERIEQLFILDGPAPVDHGQVGEERVLRWFLDDLALGLPLERLQGEPFTGLSLGEQLRKATALLGASAAVQLDLEHLLPNYQIFRDLIVAGARYRPPTIAADLTVVRVEEDVVDEFATHPSRGDGDWGWGRFTRGRVRCARVAGTHHSFLRPPLVGGWCSLLAETETGRA